MNIDPDVLSDDLSCTMGTETLLANDMVPEGLPAFSKEPAKQQVHDVGGARYLVVSVINSQPAAKFCSPCIPVDRPRAYRLSRLDLLQPQKAQAAHSSPSWPGDRSAAIVACFRVRAPAVSPKSQSSSHSCAQRSRSLLKGSFVVPVFGNSVGRTTASRGGNG
jgi:hypothetical protein